MNIDRIHNTATAVKGKIYYDDKGIAYIGLPNGRLEKVVNTQAKTVTEVITNRITNNTTTTIDSGDIDGGTWSSIYGSDQLLDGGSF